MKRKLYNENRWIIVIVFFVGIPTVLTMVCGEYLFEPYWKVATLITFLFAAGVNYQLAKNKQDAARLNVHSKLD